MNITAKVKDAASEHEREDPALVGRPGHLDASVAEVGRTAAIVPRFDDILAEAHGVSEAGAANEAGLRELSSALSRLK